MSKSRDKQAVAVIQFLNYIKQRRKLIRIGLLSVTDNEQEYYKHLWTDIKGYFGEHKLFYWFISGAMSKEEILKIYGATERRLIHYITQQKVLLFKFIAQRESELLAQFPFENGTQEFEIMAG